MYGALARDLESEVDAVDSSMALTISFNCKNITETASERQAHLVSERDFRALCFILVCITILSKTACLFGLPSIKLKTS